MRYGLQLYRTYDDGGCRLLGGRAMGVSSGDEDRLDCALVPRSREMARSCVLAVPIVEFETDRERPLRKSCFSKSTLKSRRGAFSRMEEAAEESLLPCRGVLLGDIHTPSTLTPLSIARMPKATSFSSGVPMVWRWIISVCLLCSSWSLLSSSASFMNLRNLR